MPIFDFAAVEPPAVIQAYGEAASCAASVMMIDDRTAAISVYSRMGIGGSPARSQKIAMVEASRLTRSKGFRYFKLVGPTTVGAVDPSQYSITIRMYREDELSPTDPDIWDPEKIDPPRPPKPPKD